MRKPLCKRLLALLLALTMLTGVGVSNTVLPVAAATKGEQLQAKLDRLEQQEKKIKQNLANASSDLTSKNSRKKLLEDLLCHFCVVHLRCIRSISQ